MSIIEQVKVLRELADGYKLADKPLAASTMYQAADTIESLSAKLQVSEEEKRIKKYLKYGFAQIAEAQLEKGQIRVLNVVLSLTGIC